MEISVIIPLYNKAPYIKRAIDSIKNQTHPASEIIIVDDGSTDSSNRVVSAIAKENSNIKLFTQKNMGASVARNRGVELATSDYVAFLDADDEFLENNFLSKLNSYIINYKADYILIKRNYYGKKIKPKFNFKFQNLKHLEEEFYEMVLKSLR